MNKLSSRKYVSNLPEQARLKRATSEEDKDKRRQLILNSAKLVFSEKGFYRTTIGDVAKKAKISYGSVYWYYPSKDELFHALMRYEEELLREKIASALKTLNKDSGIDAKFEKAIEATLEFFEEDQDIVKLIFRDSLALGPKFENHLYKIYSNFTSQIEQAIDQAKNEGSIIDLPTKVIAFSIAGLIGQIALRRLVTTDGLTTSEVANYIVDLLLHGIKKK